MKMKNVEMNAETRAQIVILRQEKYSLRNIAKKLKISLGAVQCALARKKETGKNMSKSHSGHPKVTSKCDDRKIVLLSKRNRKLTATDITADLNQTRDRPVSVSTIKRRLVAEGLYGRVAAKKSLLQKQNITKRLE